MNDKNEVINPNELMRVDRIMTTERSESEQAANDIISKMIAEYGNELSISQLTALKNTLQSTLSDYNIQEDKTKRDAIDIQRENARVLKDFINAKRIEGRSNTTLYNYAREVTKMFIAIGKLYRYISSGDLRDYISWRKEMSHLQNSSVANIRMYLISFFKWLKIENYIDRNPMDKIGVVKVDKKIQYIMTEEEQELMRCACRTPRDRAIVEILSSSGIRVSELIALNRDDIDFDRNQFKVMGKGSKERICYITPKAKIHLKWYLESRTDDNEALFVNAKMPFTRLTKGGVEFIIK